MFPSFGNFIQAVLLALGVVWCKEIFPKWREHVEEFRTGNGPDRAVLLLLWGITAGIFIWGLQFIGSLASLIWHGLHDLR